MTFQTRLVHTKLGWLRVELSSDEPDLLLWPGLFFDSQLHYRLAQALSVLGVSVGHVNPPGYGGSTLSVDSFTIADCGEAYLQVVEALGLESAVIGGTSWGGMSTIAAATQDADKLRGIVLMNAPVDGASPDSALRATPKLARHSPPALLSVAFLPYCLAPSSMAERAGETARMLRASLKTAHPIAREITSRAVLLEAESPRAYLESLGVPALQIAGELDRLCPVRRQRRAAELIPGVSYLELKNRGHLAAIESTAQVAGAIAGFIATL